MIMKDIEELAVKCGAYKQTEIIAKKKKEDLVFLEEIVFTPYQLQAFTNELTKQKQAVAIVRGLDEYKDASSGTAIVFDADIPVGTLLYTALPNYEALQKENERFREALEKLARLGNGEHYGNSDGNCIAIEALAKDKP
jgi:hypothetical protein